MEGIAELENAAGILMAHPGVVTQEERQNAEYLFLQFRKTTSPYQLCRRILETCKVDYVLFEAAITIKEAIIREWYLLSKDDVDSICTFLMQCATENSFQNFVREQIFQVVAVIFKLGTPDNDKAREALISDLASLLERGDRHMEKICCSVMKALLTEYSSTSQSTNFGWSLEFHARCKKTFEEKDLLNIFVLTVETLQKFVNIQLTVLSRLDVDVFCHYLSLAEHVLHWEFMNGNPLSLLRFPGNNETANKIIFRPHKNWKHTVLNPTFVDLFFNLLQTCVYNSELSHHCMQCLVQLASMAGGIFGGDEAQLEYFKHFVVSFLTMINGHQWNKHQAFGISTIIFRLVDIFPIKIIKSTPESLLSSFFEAMTHLTCTFHEAAAAQDVGNDEDNEYMEAANLLLDAWITIISHSDDFKPGVFVKHSATIVHAYLNTHLATPDGVRKLNSENNYGGDIDFEIVEDDRVACHDELSNIGQLARQCLYDVLPVLTQKLQARASYLRDYLKNYSKKDEITVTALFEDIHWLILITAFIFTMEHSGESLQVPSEIIEFNNQFLMIHKNAVSSSHQYMMSHGEICLSDEVDPVISLFTTVMKITEIELEFLRNGISMSFSPEVASTMLWFLKRFTGSYIVGNMPGDQRLSPTMTACFGLKSECGKVIVKFFLDVVEINLDAFAAEPKVSEDAVKLLLRLFDESSRGELCLTFPNFWSIGRKFSMNSPVVSSLSPSVNRLLMECFIRACSKISDKQQRTDMQSQLLQPIMVSYQEARRDKKFDVITFKVIKTFECIRGIAKASTSTNSCFLFEYIAPILQDSVNILQQYSSYTEVTVAILEMYVEVVDSMLITLNQKNSNLLCSLCLQMMDSYSKFNLGSKKIGITEEDQFYDLLLLIQLLTHILSKDYLDLNSLGAAEKDNISTVDVVLFGLQLVIPLINTELMKYPKLSNEYFKLVTFVCEVYPEKIKALPSSLFQSLMTSIQMAISDNSYGADISKCALDALSSLAKYYLNECDKTDKVNKQLHDVLQHFLNIVFQYIVVGHFNMDLIEPSAESLFLLICCHREEYLKLANKLIAQQHVSDEQFKQRLIDAFQQLTPAGFQLTSNRQSMKQFRKNLELFLQGVKGFLCSK